MGRRWFLAILVATTGCGVTKRLAVAESPRDKSDPFLVPWVGAVQDWRQPIQCCSMSVKTQEVKQYHFVLRDVDGATRQELAALIDDFNTLAGQRVLGIADKAEVTESSITITKNLADSGQTASAGEVGLGQWLSQVRFEKPVIPLPKQVGKRTIVHGMRLAFDWDYFRVQHPGFSGDDWAAKRLVFFHEIGHGLEMAHEQDPTDVMYPEVGTSARNLERFFGRVRQYLNGP